MKKLQALALCALVVASAFAVAQGTAKGALPIVKPHTANLIQNLNTGVTYLTFVAALAAAAPGQTLFVYEGTYAESVNANINVTIRGASRYNTTVTTGLSYGFRLNADWARISNLTITGASSAGVSISNQNCSVSDCIVENNYDGFMINTWAMNATIRDNTIRQNSHNGIEIPLLPTYGVRIYNNDINNNTLYGINIAGSCVIVKNNKVVYNSGQYGILVVGVKTVVDSNIVNNNGPYGIYIISNTMGGEVKNNIVTAQLYGIVTTSSGENNTIFHNKVTGCTVYGSSQNNRNHWNTSYPLGGNYWGDYTGIDIMSGPNQDLPGNDGIGDTPYVLSGPGGAVDEYPLMYFVENRTSIRINSDTDFDAAHGVTGGDGSPANPWRIEYFNINASSLGCGIYIGNTTQYFIINHCYLHYSTGGGGSQWRRDAGIFLYNTFNGTVYDNNVSQNNGIGILVRDTGSAPANNVIQYNDLFKNNQNSVSVSSSIGIINSHWNSVRGCNISNAPYYGVRIDNGNNNTIEDSKIAWITTGGAGIGLFSTYYTIVSGNDISNSSGHGIQTNVAPFATIESNTIKDSNRLSSTYYGINFILSNRGNILNNTISTTLTQSGIWLDGSNLNLIEGNAVTSNGAYGIHVQSAIFMSNDNTIRDNNFSTNIQYGADFGLSTTRNLVYHNNFLNNNGGGAQAADLGTNLWNESYPIGGNYWSNYAGVDVMCGPAQTDPGGDGFGDTPYAVSARWDYYPLMTPWTIGEKFHRPPIRIDDDSVFDAAHGVVNWDTGDGSAGNPWRIEGYDINGTGYGYCIYVGNTTDYFTISNCTTYNATGYEAWPGFAGAGIHFYQVLHGVVRDCNASGNDYAGILAWDSNYCDIVKNDAWREKTYGGTNGGSGVWIAGGSLGCNVSANDLGWSQGPGIRVSDSQWCNISGNNISYNDQMIGAPGGLFVESSSWQSNNHTLLGNYITHNPYYGVHLLCDNDTIISGNEVLFNCGGEAGIYVDWSNRVVCTGNNVSNGTGVGFNLLGAQNCTVDNNTIRGNVGDGIYSGDCFWNDLVYNNISNNGGNGIFLTFSYFNSINNNSICGNAARGVNASIGNDNWIIRNDFIDNALITQGSDWGVNFWNASYPYGGNYWNEYTDLDDYWGEDQDMPGWDGIWDHPYSIGSASSRYDQYPLMRSIYTADTMTPISRVDTIAFWNNATPITITALAGDLSGVADVTLWYSHSDDFSIWSPWAPFGIDTASPWEWSFDFPDGELFYGFFSVANDTAGHIEPIKGIMETSCYVDYTKPVSSVDPIVPYWSNTVRTISMTASDTPSGIGSVELWYRFAPDNATWTAWWAIDTVGGMPPYQSFFMFPDGQGYYEFFSRARDVVDLREDWKGSAEARTAFDDTPPSSAADVVGPYWRATSFLTITATASDLLSGVKEVQLYYRAAADNITWIPWSLYATDSAPPWSWDVSLPWGNTFYEFYTIAVDKASNTEAAPGLADVCYAWDGSKPVTQALFTGPYWRRGMPLIVDASAIDMCAVYVELWFRFAPDNSTWGAWTKAGNDTAGPSWQLAFNWPAGQGFYEFNTRGGDAIGSYEDAHGSADARWAYDITSPATAATQGSPYERNGPVSIDATVSDAVSGLYRVGLSYRFSADNGTTPWGAWTFFVNDTASPWQFTFNWPDGAGYYEFYTKGWDNAGNFEAPPALADVKYRNLGDITPPVSSVNAISGYWHTASPLTINATATDALSGVKNVTLRYRFSAINVTWSPWFNVSTDEALPWSWSFAFANGSGYYQFYSLARDNATNNESAPATADTACAYDSRRPTIVDSSASTATTGEMYAITATVGDNLALYAVYAVYWFGANSPTNVSMAGTPRTANIPVPANGLAPLHYFVAAVDQAGNWNATIPRALSIVDNDPPSAVAGDDVSVNWTGQVNFTAFGSDDNVGIMNYTWTFTYNGSAVTLYGMHPVFVFWEPGDHAVTLTVADAAGLTDTDTMVVQVGPAPDETAPIAGAGADVATVAGQVVTFDGSGSTDNVGVTGYTWTFTYNGTTWTMFGPGPHFIFWTPGTYEITLTVRDDAGNVATDTVTVTVAEAPGTGGGGGDWTWIAAIIIVVVVIVLLVAFLKMRGKGPEEDDGEEPEESAGKESETGKGKEGAAPPSATQPKTAAKPGNPIGGLSVKGGQNPKPKGK